jgi:uncharacterized membrane protein YciS (DUF1049 family)
MRKVLAAAVLIPLVIVIVAFALANREIIAISFDPFDTARPAFLVRMPLFLLIFILVGLGVLIGGVAAWLRQYKWRARARRAEAELRELRTRIAAESPAAHTPARVDTPPLAIPRA